MVVLHDWLLTLIASLPLLLLWRKQRKERRLNYHGFCPKCAYNLHAHHPGDNCPECGTPISQPRPFPA